MRHYFYEGEDHVRKFGIAVINRNHDLIGFGLYDDVEAAVVELRPELNEITPIEEFRDVLVAHNVGNPDIALNRI